MLLRSSAESLAVPMSMPRYSCIESALTISPPSAVASRIPSSDFPTAVGPTTAIPVHVLTIDSLAQEDTTGALS